MKAQHEREIEERSKALFEAITSEIQHIDDKAPSSEAV